MCVRVVCVIVSNHSVLTSAWCKCMCEGGKKIAYRGPLSLSLARLARDDNSSCRFPRNEKAAPPAVRDRLRLCLFFICGEKSKAFSSHNILIRIPTHTCTNANTHAHANTRACTHARTHARTQNAYTFAYARIRPNMHTSMRTQTLTSTRDKRKRIVELSGGHWKHEPQRRHKGVHCKCVRGMRRRQLTHKRLQRHFQRADDGFVVCFFKMWRQLRISISVVGLFVCFFGGFFLFNVVLLTAAMMKHLIVVYLCSE